MSLEKLLSQERAALVKRWFDRIIETYPPETVRLLRKETNPFANPVGHTIYRGLEGVYGELLQGGDSEKMTPLLDSIVRIRAVQDFPPSQAIGFIFFLKAIVREEAQKESWKDQISSEALLAFDAQVDALALLAFNIYVVCREKLYELKVDEVKRRTQRLLQRANLIAELPDEEPQS